MPGFKTQSLEIKYVSDEIKIHEIRVDATKIFGQDGSKLGEDGLNSAYIGLTSLACEKIRKDLDSSTSIEEKRVIMTKVINALSKTYSDMGQKTSTNFNIIRNAKDLKVGYSGDNFMTKCSYYRPGESRDLRDIPFEYSSPKEVFSAFK